MTLVEFLLARIAEDEGRAPVDHFKGDPEDVYYWCAGARVPGDPANGDLEVGEQFCDCHLGKRRKRVLAECEAKRRIIEWHQDWPFLVARARFGSEAPTGPVLRFLAVPYADHPDWREEWRPVHTA